MLRREIRPLLWSAVALGASLYLWLVVQVLVTDTRLVTTFADLSHPWWRAVRVLLPDGRADRPVDDVLLAAWTVAIGASVATFVPFADRTRRVPDMQGVLP